MPDASAPAPKKKKIMVPRVVNGQDTYVEIEVDDVAVPTWGPKSEHTLINHSIQRIDGPVKVSGRALYTHDIRVPRLLHGRILHSPHPRAHVVSIDTSRAEKMRGVKAVVTLAESGKSLRYEGDPVAAVAAETPEIAEDALRAIKVVYKKLPHAVTPDQAMAKDAPRVYQGRRPGDVEGNVRVGEGQGDRTAAEAALKTCDAVVERELTITSQHHVCLETHGVVVDYRGGDTATVYASTQGTFSVPGEAADALGLKGQDAVTSVVEHMGGGFGSKFGLDLPGSVACRLSKAAGAPVHLLLTRPQEFLMAGHRPGAIHKVKAGATKDGKLVAMVAEQYMLGGLGEGGLAGLPYIYSVQTRFRVMNVVHTNQDSGRAMRAPGHPPTAWAMESIMDDLAAAIDMDPLEFRKRNLRDTAYHRQLVKGAEAIGWSRRPKTPGGGPAYGPYKSLKRGIGCGLATWGGGGGPECQVDVFIRPDGAVAVQVGTQDLGTGTRTYTAAIVAEEFGLNVADVETRIGHSSYGRANSSGGSTTTASLAPAVKYAAFSAKTMLFQKAAPLLGARPEDLVARSGKVYPGADPSMSLTWKQACATLGQAGISARGEWKPGLSGNGVHGAQFAEVEVDTDTGRVHVIKMVGVQDCGLPMNRLTLESQLNGGMIQGLGYALLERHWVDSETGNMLNSSMEDYKVPGTLEIPEMVPIIDDGDTREFPIGMAEPAAIPGAGAIANAVFNAIGVRITSLPITPDKILDALAKRA